MSGLPRVVLMVQVRISFQASGAGREQWICSVRLSVTVIWKSSPNKRRATHSTGLGAQESRVVDAGRDGKLIEMDFDERLIAGMTADHW